MQRDVRSMHAVPSLPPALATRLQALGVEIVSGSVLLEPYDEIAISRNSPTRCLASRSRAA